MDLTINCQRRLKHDNNALNYSCIINILSTNIQVNCCFRNRSNWNPIKWLWKRNVDSIRTKKICRNFKKLSTEIQKKSKMNSIEIGFNEIFLYNIISILYCFAFVILILTHFTIVYAQWESCYHWHFNWR